MARNYNKAANNAAAKSNWIDVTEGVQIKGTKDKFSISWFGAVIHGCKVRKAANGGEFISWPAFKGSNGNYIKTAYVYAAKDSDDELILNAVIAALS